VLGARKDDGRVAVVAREQVLEEFAFAGLGHQVERVVDGVGGSGSRQLGHVRVPQHVVRQPPHLLGHGGREEQVLAAPRQRLEDPPDVRQEALVEHMVGLVEHENLDLAQTEHALLEQVEHASGAADHDLGAPAEGADLTADRDASVQGHHLDAGELGERADLGRNLGGQLPGGSDHQGLGAVLGSFEEPVEQGQRERGRLAGTGMGQAQHVAAVEAGGNGLVLDGTGVFEASGADSALESLVELEPVEAGRSFR